MPALALVLATRVGLDRRRLTALAPEVDPLAREQHFTALELIEVGAAGGGPVFVRLVA
ncbi:MAG: hypothetical protein H0V22_01080 [Solirubrobacterales bacterium]|nr:hypothetical protein [Solirubrobacterales bacterium]